MKTEIITNVSFNPSFERLGEAIRLDAYPELEPEVRELFELSSTVAQPKATYRRCSVEKVNGADVVIAGGTFHSEALADNLDGVEEVVAYVATCGRELDGVDLSAYDPLSLYWISVIKELALQAATQALFQRLEEDEGRSGLSQMNPGSANVDVWPIEQQVELFAILADTEASIGVRLTESYLMVPDKSVSGILFESETGYVNCHACDRENCPNRRAPYMGAEVR